MTDQIPAEDVREIAEKMRYHASQEHVRRDAERYFRFFAKQLDALLSAPPRPTLADMTTEERDECRWMQCDVRNAVVTHGVLAKNHGGDAHVLDAEGEVWFLSPTDVTPRPDLPRLEWPGGTPTGPDHLAVGTVIESADDPRVDALPVGSILIDSDEEATTKGRGEWTGAGYIPIPGEGTEYGPWTVLHIPKEEA